MKKFYLFVMLALICGFANAQIEPTNYRGAFAPAPTAMWTDSWTNWAPNAEAYTDAATVVNVTTDITVNTTWTTGKTYKMNGLIYVKNNATLTIQPGVIVKGIYSSTGTALVITKGAKINAVGTATSPIVFTSAKAAGSRLAGDWGGIILLGKAGFNLNNGINNIEGIAASVNTEYGGGASPIDNDNSGTLKYVRIEYGGFVFSPNNEINGLTFGAVGSGTTIDYVQVSYAGDDSFEWFGGAVNCKHIVAYRGLDDDFDTDNGFKGTVQFALGVRDPAIADNPAISTSEGFESDNNAATTEAAAGYDNTSAIFTNCTLIGPSYRSASVAAGYARALRLRRTTELKIYNSIFLDFKNNYAGLTDDQTIAKYYVGKLKLKNNIFAGFYGSDFASFPEGINPRTKTGNATTNALGFPTGTAFNLGAKMVADGNTTIASSTGILTKAYDADLSLYSGLDYRPGAVASTGADFSDASFAPYLTVAVGELPVVSPKSYCKGAVATELTATMTTTGASLKWYTLATGGVGTATAPKPLTSTVGVKNYYVTQINTSGVESARVALAVTINAIPTEVLGVITGTGPVGSTSAVAIGKYVGTSAAFTYTVPAFADASLSYLWTVPNGATITNGQGTNTITVNYLNEPAGAGAAGSIQVQAVNASGCKTLAKTLALTKALPAAPVAIKMTDAAMALPVSGIATAITSYAKYMGTTTPLTLTATTVDAASSYKWELPAGVNVVTTSTPVPTTVYYTAEPFLSSAQQPSVDSPPAGTGASSGLKYWAVTYNTYNEVINGVATVITKSTAVQKMITKSPYSFVADQAYASYGTVITSDKPVILVNFAGVTNPATTKLYLGVKSKNGVGASVTNNATNADVVLGDHTVPGLFSTVYTETFTAPIPPTTNAVSVYNATGFAASTAKLLKLTAALPAAPSAIKMTNDAVNPLLAVTVISKFVGTTTPFTLTATPSATATSYTWELPAGVNPLSSLTGNVITVNFAGVAPGTTSLYIGVKAVNGIGSSNTITNGTLVPATSSTAKLLKLTAAVPAAVTIVTGQIAGVCGGSSYSYTMTPSLLATSYVINAPVGSVVTSVSNMANTTASLTTTDLTFTVTYPAGFVAVTATPVGSKSVVITSVNGVGNSLLNKSLVISTMMPSVGVATGGTTFTRCATKTISVPMVIGATSYLWTVADGATIVTGQGTNTVEVDFTAVASTKTTNTVKVAAINACGTSSLVKSIILTSTACPVPAKYAAASISSTEVYPNPVSSNFKIDVTASVAGSLEIAIYSLDGTMAVSPKTVALQEGINTISENVSSLKSGIYIVQLVNSSNNEVITKKLVKN
jgi:hypothetical protein